MKQKDYIQEFLLQNPDTWREKIVSDFNLKYRESEDYVLISYSLIDAPKFEYPLAIQGRGSIFKKGSWKRVCNPFDKFFNYGEEHADHIDFSENVAVIDKVDGSILKLWYDQEWKVSTNGTIDLRDAGILLESPGYKNFYDILVDVEPNFFNFQEKDFDLPKNYTYIFEILHEKNPIVVEQGNRIYLIGIRNNDLSEDFLIHTESELDLIEILKKEFPRLELPELIHGKYDSYADLVKHAESLNEENEKVVKEGFIVLNYIGDQVIRRVKIKASQYLLFSSFNNLLYSRNQFVEKIQTGDQEEIKVYLEAMPKHLQELWDDLEFAYLKMKEKIKVDITPHLPKWDELSRKDFFIYLHQQNLSPYSRSVLINMILNGLSFEQAVLDSSKSKFKNELLKYIEE